MVSFLTEDFYSTPSAKTRGPKRGLISGVYTKGMFPKEEGVGEVLLVDRWSSGIIKM